MRFLSKFIALGVLLLTLLGFSGVAVAQSVKIKVNDTAITENQISQRAALLRLERRGGSNAGRRKIAMDELIDEALIFEEGRRLKIAIAPAGVDQAYSNIAKGMRANAGRLTQILNKGGVQSKTLKDRLHSSLVWRTVVRTSVSKTVKISEKEIIDALGDDPAQQVVTYDYLLKEVVFFVSKGSSKKSQTAQARTYKRNFSGCDSAVELSLGYKDAGVRTIGRRHSTQFPDALSAELAKTLVGGITSPRVTKTGVQMLAVCAKTEARDITFLSNAKRSEIGNEKIQAAAEAALKALRDKATIVYR